MRRFLIVTLALIGLPFAALAQSGETLADIRQELSVLYVEVQKLNRELSTTGATGAATSGSSLLDRVNTIESELARLTAKTEELEFQIKSVVRDGTNRIGDLEFRLCELESDCDIGQLKEGTTLGGVDVSGAAAMSTTADPATDPGVEMAVGEQADFERAEQALAAGQYAEAAGMLATYRQTYPGGPLSARAGVLMGKALEGSGDMTGAARAYLDVFSTAPEGAARAYLDVFSTAPEGPEAPDALYNLGRTLGKLGQTQEGCVTLSEVAVRFPASPFTPQAQAEMSTLGCT